MVHKIWEDYPHIEKGIEKVIAKMKQSIHLPMTEINNKILEYIDAPGKYLRTGIVLMVANALNLPFDNTIISAAAGLELLHLSTLIHDDVIDHASTRRGIDALHQTHSNRIAIYAGDYLLSVSGRLLNDSGLKLSRNKLDDKLIEHILIGELRQLMNQNSEDMTLSDYLRQISGKTATLFGMATMIPAIKAELSMRETKRLFYAGQMIGMAFQINDDLIDYHQSAKISGKPQMQDIQNGIYTAPYLMLKQIQGSLSTLSLQQISELMEEKNIYVQVEALREQYLTKSWRYFSLVNVDYSAIESLIHMLEY